MLLAAGEVWRDRGFAQTTVEDLLVAADVSRATFYLEFSSKEDVAAALFQRAIERLMVAVAQRVAATKGLRERLSLGLDVYLELFETHGRVIQELSVEALRPGSRLGAMRQFAVNTVASVVRDALRLEGGVDLEPLGVKHLILGAEAVLLHMLIDAPLDASTRPSVHARLLPLLLSPLETKT